MGAGQSRRKPGAGTSDVNKYTIGLNHPEVNSGYFILSLREDKVKVVNAESSELKLLTMLIRRHCKIVKEGWDRHLTYSYKLKVSGRHCMIQLVADTLLCLYRAGWQPMTPIDVGLQKYQKKCVGHQTAICFRKRESKEEFVSTDLLSQSTGSGTEENSCLCLETYQDTYLGFHNVCNEVLLELVTTIQERWSPGIKGVSIGVASVISDYCADMPKVLPGFPGIEDEKFIKLKGRPWSLDAEEGKALEDSILAEKLQISIVACLSKEGYKLGMDINMDRTSRVFFFIKSVDDNKAEVRVPNNAGAGLGEKDTLSVYRPLLLRHKSSFFRSYNGKTAFLRKKVQASLRRKAVARQGRQDTVMSYKPVKSEPAWWQQTSTDMSSEYDDDDE